MSNMNRARNELAAAIMAIEEQAEHVERDAARRRWRMELECELLRVRFDATTARRLMNQ